MKLINKTPLHVLTASLIVLLVGCESTSTKPVEASSRTNAAAPQAAVVIAEPAPVIKVSPTVQAVVVEKPTTVERSEVVLTKYFQARLAEMEDVCGLSDAQYNVIANLFVERSKELKGVSSEREKRIIFSKYHKLFQAELTAEQQKKLQASKKG